MESKSNFLSVNSVLLLTKFTPEACNEDCSVRIMCTYVYRPEHPLHMAIFFAIGIFDFWHAALLPLTSRLDSHSPQLAIAAVRKIFRVMYVTWEKDTQHVPVRKYTYVLNERCQNKRSRVQSRAVETDGCVSQQINLDQNQSWHDDDTNEVRCALYDD